MEAVHGLDDLFARAAISVLLDGECTLGLDPLKSNWTLPIDTAPLDRSYPL
jgi:hypothetical protein